MTDKKICIVCHPAAEQAIKEALESAGIHDVEVKGCKVDRDYIPLKDTAELKNDVIKSVEIYKTAMSGDTSNVWRIDR